MPERVPDVTLDIDLRNPGQVFACCGVLELAGRVWPGSEGWFAKKGPHASFCLTTGVPEHSIGELLELLAADGPLVALAGEHEHLAADRKPVMVRAPFDLRLDWWLDSYRDSDKSELKVWAGQMTPERNLLALQEKLRELTKGNASALGRELLSARVPGSGMGLDPSTSWKALDVGFSPDEQNVDVLVSPATEILAMIGLQRCRPAIDRSKRRRWFIYRCWADPLESSVACAAIVGAGRSVGNYTFPVVMRNAQYGNLGWANLWEARP